MPDILTRRQREVLDVILKYISENGVPPTLSEIRDAMGISSLRGVTDHLDALERKGWLERTGTKGAARCWRVTTEEAPEPEQLAPFASLPLVGTIAAGIPITAIEHVEEHVAVPLALTGNATECFILRVMGDSMIGDAICDGDLAILRAQSTARSGDIIAALIDDEATLKHYVKIGMRIELHSSNPIYAPIPIQHENTRILGKLVGLMRPYS
ncbi:MAG: transcriptional repressor LexA [Armatimonadetes bacterium]|nr:transcriptional repressor LexA [Armatimonadota bacterium]